jgi:hypothetical protein
MVDWPGLLKWSVTQSDGTTFNKDMKPMDQETKKWLEEAMEELTFNEVKRMKEVTNRLAEKENPDDPQDEERRLAFLDDLLDYVDGLENARDLVKIGQYPILIDVMLNSCYEEVRKSAYLVFASCNTINAYVQHASIENGAMNLLNSIIKEKRMSNKEQAVSALSSFIKGESLNIKRAFIDVDGVEFLLELLSNDKDYDSAKIKTKTMAMLNDMVYYDDKLDHADMISFNKEQGSFSKQINEKTSSLITLKKPQEESKEKIDIENDKPKEEFSRYKNIVKKKLIETNFVEMGFKFVDANSFKNLMDVRPAYFSILINLIQFDPKMKLSKEQLNKINGFLTGLIEESKKQEDLYDSEIHVIKNLLALHN